MSADDEEPVEAAATEDRSAPDLQDKAVTPRAPPETRRPTRKRALTKGETEPRTADEPRRQRGVQEPAIAKGPVSPPPSPPPPDDPEWGDLDRLEGAAKASQRPAEQPSSKAAGSQTGVAKVAKEPTVASDGQAEGGDALPNSAKRTMSEAAAAARRSANGGHFRLLTLLLAALPPAHVRMDLVLCEYSGEVATKIAATGTPVLAVDHREPEYEPEASNVFYYQGDLQDVALLRKWRRAISFPPCEHQARSSTSTMMEKALDGRTWWGMCLLLYCYCIPAEVALVENPRNYWTRFYGTEGGQVVHPYFFGDDRKKTTYLFIRGTSQRLPHTNNLGAGDTTWHARSFSSAEEQNKFRCRLLPGMAAAIAEHLPVEGNGTQLCYSREVEKMARRWHGYGLPLPRHYDSPDARSPDPAVRAYQGTRGRGEGGKPELVEAPDTLTPAGDDGKRTGCKYPFIPLKDGEVARPLPKCLRAAAVAHQFECITRTRTAKPTERPEDIEGAGATNASLAEGAENDQTFGGAEWQAAVDIGGASATPAPDQMGAPDEAVAADNAAPQAQVDSGRASAPDQEPSDAHHSPTLVSLEAAVSAQTVAVFPVRHRQGQRSLVLLPTPQAPGEPTCFGSNGTWPDAQPGKQRKWIAEEGWRVAQGLRIGAQPTSTFLASSPATSTTMQLAVVATLVKDTAAPPPASSDRELSEKSQEWVPLTAIANTLLRRAATAAVLQVQRLAEPGAAQRDGDGPFATGAQEAAQVGGAPWHGPAALDGETQRKRLETAKERFTVLAHARAAHDAFAADALVLWADRMRCSDEAHPMPEVLEKHLLSPEWPELANTPFRHYCAIPKTEARPPRVAAAPPPPDLPTPANWQECVGDEVAREILEHWTAIEEWHQGRRQNRPRARSWPSDSFAEPWRTYINQGHVLDFRQGQGRWLPLEGLAKNATINLEAWREFFAEYPHQRALAHALHGVDYQAALEPTITIAPNLHSMYATQGGVEAVAIEFRKHADAGFREICGERQLPFVPFRSPPCGCAERRDEPGRPRVLNDEGFPHETHLTELSRQPVTSRNAAAAPMRPTEGDANPKWFLEKKPRIRDAAMNAAILAYLAHTLGGVGLTFVFDFKYFFHQFVLAAHELWASGALVPELLPDGSVSPHLRCVVTMVMAMGVSPASNIAQEVANMLMWKLLRMLDAASGEYVKGLCRDNPEFARVWRVRQRLAHDDYGTQARLADALQFTDDAVMGASTPEIAVELLVQFAHMVGAPHMWAPAAMGPRKGAQSVAHTLARVCNASRVPRPHGLNLPAAKPEKWHAGGQAPWIGAVLAIALGAVWITAPKIFRTLQGVKSLLDGQMPIAKYHSFVSFVASLADLRERGAYDMHGLWEPLREGQEVSRGPTTTVDVLSPHRTRFRLRWVALQEAIATTRGCALLEAARVRVPQRNLVPPIVFEIHADASGNDAASPGMGTYLYGKWQHFPLTIDSRLENLHVSHHEAIAAGLALIMADELLPRAAAVDVITDALATFVTMHNKARRATMVAIHEEIQALPAFKRRSGDGKLRVRHRWGELNVGADAASRMLVDVLEDVGAAVGLDAERLEHMEAQWRFIDDVLRATSAVRTGASSTTRRRQRACDPAVPGGTAIRFMAPGHPLVPPRMILNVMEGLFSLLEGNMSVDKYMSFMTYATYLANLGEEGRSELRWMWEPLLEGQELLRGPDTPVDTASAEREWFRLKWWRFLGALAYELDDPILLTVGVREPDSQNSGPPVMFELLVDIKNDDTPIEGLGPYLYGSWVSLPHDFEYIEERIIKSHRRCVRSHFAYERSLVELEAHRSEHAEVMEALAELKRRRGAPLVGQVAWEELEDEPELPTHSNGAHAGKRRRTGDAAAPSNPASGLSSPPSGMLRDKGCPGAPSKVNPFAPPKPAKVDPHGIAWDRHALFGAEQQGTGMADPEAERPSEAQPDVLQTSQWVRLASRNEDPAEPGGTAVRHKPGVTVVTRDGAMPLPSPAQSLLSPGLPADAAPSLRSGSAVSQPRATGAGTPIRGPLIREWPAAPESASLFNKNVYNTVELDPHSHAAVAVPPTTHEWRAEEGPPAPTTQWADHTTDSRGSLVGAARTTQIAVPRASASAPALKAELSAPLGDDADAGKALLKRLRAPPNASAEAKKAAADRGSTLRRALLSGAGSGSVDVGELARALEEDSSDLALRPKDPDVFRALLAASVRARAARFASTTNKADTSYWKKWSAFCREVYGTNPVRYDTQAASDPTNRWHAREVQLALSAFVYWCLQNPQYKPASMLARLRGVAREHRKMGLKFVDLSLVVDACKGIIRLLVAEHGPEVTEVRRKEPLQPWMMRRWLSLPPGVKVGEHTVGSSLAWRGVRVFITLMACSGFRKADVALDAGVRFGRSHLSLGYVFYRIGGVFTRAPSKAQLQAVRGGRLPCVVCVRPPPSKADPDGSKWGSSPICSEFDATEPINFAREMVEYELARGVWDEEERMRSPLLLNKCGGPWRKHDLAEFFKLLLLQIMAAEQAKHYSIHSFRIFLACALRDAGFPNAVIQETLRWATDEALLLYARANVSCDAEIRARAASAHVDSIRVPTVLSSTPSSAQPMDVESAALLEASAIQEPVDPGMPSEATMEQALRTAATAARRRGAVAAGSDLPDVDSDLRAFSGMSLNMGPLQREAARPIDGPAGADEDGDEEPGDC